MAQVTLKSITKRFGELTVVPNLDLVIKDKEFVVLVGPSGCGKTTTLRMIAGLESASSGSIYIGDNDVTGQRPGMRNCAMVFQNYALYPHMSVRDNITYGMKVRGESVAKRESAVDYAAKVLGLEPYLDRRPANLSGGQRQRVAIGRAIVRDPEVFLFDEPLSNLDAKLRIEMRAEIKSLHERLQRTILYDTHDQVEAMTLADRVVLMNAGRIEQADDPITLYERPANRFVAAFIGAPSMNFIPVMVEIRSDSYCLRVDSDTTLAVPPVFQRVCRRLVGKRVTLGIRPEDVRDVGSAVTAPLLVNNVELLGPHTLVSGTIGGSRVTAQVDAHFKARAHDVVPVCLMMNKMHLFDDQTGVALRDD